MKYGRNIVDIWPTAEIRLSGSKDKVENWWKSRIKRLFDKGVI